MFLTKNDPTASHSPVGILRREVDRIFDTWGGLLATDKDSSFRPHINVIENQKHLFVTVELPGLEENDVEIEVTPDALVLRGEKSRETSEEGETWYRSERTFGSFERSIPLPWKSSEDPARAKAVFKNGLLKIIVDRPTHAQPKSKRVEIESS